MPGYPRHVGKKPEETPLLQLRRAIANATFRTALNAIGQTIQAGKAGNACRMLSTNIGVITAVAPFATIMNTNHAVNKK
jgi:hypothetical protein